MEMDNENEGFDLEDVLERLDSELTLIRNELHKSVAAQEQQVEQQKTQNELLVLLVQELRKRG